jgi:hypothetical protein
MKGRSKTAAYRALMAAVIDRAIDDLKGTESRCGKKETDRAMAFILSEDCEAWCLELSVDYEAVREKARTLYRNIIEKETPGTAMKKRPGRPSNGLRRVCLNYACTRKTPYRYR